jgi:hypothetical protein
VPAFLFKYLTKIFKGAIVEREVIEMKKTALLIAVAAMVVLLTAVSVAGVEPRKASVSDEFQIQIVQPLQIMCTYRGDSKLGPGMSSNVAYIIRNNLENYPIEVKYFVKVGPYINFTISISREIVESIYKEEILAISYEGGSVSSTFVVNPQEQLYFFVKYTISENAPAPAQTFIKVTLEEFRIITRG